MERNYTEELLLALQGELWNYAYSLTWERNRADDLLQETFTRALCNAGSFDGNNQQFSSWTHTIMHHTFINSIKKEEYADSVHFGDSPFANKDLERRRSDERLITSDIYSAIDNLPGNTSKVMRLLVSGHKYGEISVIMKIPLGTVKTRISQARAILKEQLKDYLS